MNVYATDAGSYDYGNSRLSPTAPSPNAKTLVEGYRKDIITGFEKDPPRFNPMNPDRTQSSALVDLKDPIQVHLLTETALSDSKQYEILSQEEVDDLKKQIQSLSQRTESTRANLLIQSKYRDAAISMARLYSPGRTDGRRRSLLGRNSGDQTRAKEAEAERQASERKCEELASELFNLEKRLMEPQRRLLEHTAGILQLTHKVSKKKDTTPQGQPPNGMPGSPESLYTYSRNSMDQAADGNYFDESPYEFDELEGLQPNRNQPRTNAIEIPLKSPIREQNNQLRDEMERVKEENNQLRRQTDSLVQSISDMEVRLENLNGSLRDAIVRFNPTKNEDYEDPPYGFANNMEPGEMLKSQMEYLETGLFAIQAEQEESHNDEKMTERIVTVNNHVREILLTVDPAYPAAPHAFETDVEGQLAYLEDSLRAVDSEFERALDSANTGTTNNLDPRSLDADRVETVLTGLWEIIQSGFANIKQEKEERRRARKEKGIDDEEISDDEFDTEEPYTLTGFSTRVQWLYQQATTLKHQKSVLKRQIKQQRELNNKSDAEKDEELARKQEEIEESRVLISRAEKDAMDAQMMLSEALEDLEKAREAANSGASHANIAARDAEIQERDAQIQHHNVQAQELAAQIKRQNAEVEEYAARIEECEAQIEEHFAEIQERDAQIEKNIIQMQQRDAQIEERNAQIEERDSQIQQYTSQQQVHAAEIQERNAKISVLESDLQELQAHIHSAESNSQNSQNKLGEVEATIATLTAQLAEATKYKEEAQELQKQFDTQQEELSKKTKVLKVKEDELELLNMNLAEIKTELTIAQAELDGAYGSRAERAADVAAIKTNAEVAKFQNQITRLKKELSGTVQDLEDVTRESLNAEREKIQLENKMEDVMAEQSTLEAEVNSLRQRLEEEVEKSRERMAQLQEELDGERLKAQGASGRPGTGATMLSEQFRTTMRNERKKFQEELREERVRNRKLEEELGRLKRGQGANKAS